MDKDQCITVDPGTKPTEMSDEDWKKLDRKAKSTIRFCVSDSVLLNISGEATAKNLWEKLGTLYQSKSLVNKLFLRKNLLRKERDLMMLLLQRKKPPRMKVGMCIWLLLQIHM